MSSLHYRFLLSDLVMDDLRHMRQDNVPPCTYYMVTNGDNLYSSSLIPAAVDLMRDGVDLIGFEFISRYRQMHEDMVDHIGRPDQVCVCDCTYCSIAL
jgi:hypothetical protein